jgi:GT2 family glycosyltransferase
MPDFSLILCSRDDVRYSRFESNARAMLGNVQIIRIADAGGMAQGYERGMSQAVADRLIFCHDDVEFIDFIGDRVKDHLGRCDILGIAGTDKVVDGRWDAAGPDHLFGQVACPDSSDEGYAVNQWNRPMSLVTNIQAVDGCFIGCRREAAEQIGWDAKTFDGWHFYDLDFCLRAFQQNLSIGIACDLPIAHRSAGDFGDDWRRALMCFREKWRHALDSAAVVRYVPRPAIRCPDADAAVSAMTRMPKP